MAQPPKGEKSLLWLKLFEHLLTQIKAAELPFEGAFPSEKQLCLVHGVSRITVRRALRELELMGLLQRQRGSGSVVVQPSVVLSPRNIHVVMTPDGHVLNDLHQALMFRLGELSFSHQTWVPGHGSTVPDELAATPAHGTIIVPWHVEMLPFQQQAAKLGRCVVLVPDAGSTHGFPGIGIDFVSPIRELLERARTNKISSVYHVTYRDTSEQHAVVGRVLAEECRGHQFQLRVFYDFDRGEDSEFTALGASVLRELEPVLVLCASDFIASKLHHFLGRIGKRVPHDVALVGMYDTPWSQAGNLSTVNVRPTDLVNGALRLIIDERENTSFMQIPGQLIIRDSGPGVAS